LAAQGIATEEFINTAMFKSREIVNASVPPF